MKKIISILLCFSMIMTLIPAMLAGAADNITDDEYIFWVSPDGNDENDGQTEETPWKTLYKAAQTLQSGQTAIFKDGIYNETQYTEFANYGTKESGVV